MQKFVTCLGFDNTAEEALNFYTSIIKNSRVLSTLRAGEHGPGPKDALIAANFELDGQEFMVLNGGPAFTHSIGMSILIKCDSQAEIDDLWQKLTANGGQEGQCGWLTDRFGISWQVIPRELAQLLKSPGALQAMLKMRKLDIATLQGAATPV
jgi:predicted 3-demethylubiquinone-9 3-methyltransferase (glyoxalase superfamily)